MIGNADRLATTAARRVALDCIEAGIRAARPERIVAETIGVDDRTLVVDGTCYALDDYRKIVVLGGGNAAAHVASALEAELGDRIDGGIVVTDDPTGTERIDVLQGDHPTPSARGVESTTRVAEAAASAGEETLVLGVLTGGGSALLAAPAGEVTLTDLEITTRELLESGATIGEINAVRKHLSTVKGGLLARAASPATVVGLLLSDVVGDDPSTIASGPLTPDDSTYEGERPETPRADDGAFDRIATHVIGSNYTALTAAAATARDRGYEPVILSTRVRGEARETAKTHVAIGEQVRATGDPVDPPAVLLSGGETTVTVSGDGTGGPNHEFALSSALELHTTGVTVASVDTDGLDGATDAAGAIVDRTTVDGKRTAATRALAANDAAPVLGSADATIETGPTGTNVNDLRVVVVEGD
ncbi:glycerate kinase [Halobacteriales archaeon QH_9_66_26]|nr:MAG: glycerate kinase [Halobacteriales archaeon QH_9_66_26]